MILGEAIIPCEVLGEEEDPIEDFATDFDRLDIFTVNASA
jgi:hypothetical protein